MARFELNRRERPGERRESHSRSHSTWCFLSLSLFPRRFPPRFGISRPLVPLFRHRHPSRSHLPAPFRLHSFPMQMHSPPLRLSLSSFCHALSYSVCLFCTFLTSSWMSRSSLSFSLSLSLSRSPYDTPTMLCFFV